MSTDQTHIAFLRAVNVGGRKVEMAGLGLGSVRTYIATGNAFFTSPETDRTGLVERMETDRAGRGLRLRDTDDPAHGSGAGGGPGRPALRGQATR